MPGILEYTLEQYQEGARTYRSQLLRIPLLTIANTLKFMTLRFGIRYEEAVGATNLDVELQPYKRNAVQSGNLEIVHRVLKTYFGTVNEEFDPNENISTLLGHSASMASGDALATTPQAHEVIALTPKVIGKKLDLNLFKAVRNPNGTKTSDLFDGFDTITDKEIAAGKISSAVGNYMMLDAVPDKNNAVEIAQSVLESLSPELRAEECYLYCPQSFADAYNKAYKLESGGISYNTEYGQVAVEGSNGLLKIVPLVGKAGSKYLHVSPKENMLVGVDQISDQESVRVGNYSPDTFTLMMRMFFGCQFESIDPRRFFCAEIPA